jgi:hypothetical protein
MNNNNINTNKSFMKYSFLAYVAFIIFAAACTTNTEVKDNNDGVSADSKVLAGTWIYRSLLNGTNVNTDFDSLAFAAATIKLNGVGKDSLNGQILWPIDSTGKNFNGLNLSGKCFYNDTTLCYFLAGIGDSALGTAGWQYNYQGYMILHWPEGIDQATVLVGSVVRVKKHSCDSSGNNCHPAGVVASTYMVKD